MIFLLIAGAMFLAFMSIALVVVASAPLWDADRFIGVPEWLAWGMTGFAVVFVVLIWAFIIREARNY